MNEYRFLDAGPGRSSADGVAFRPIGSDRPVRLNAERCLALRSRYSDCRRCEEVCPAGVLRVSGERIELADGCLRCGRCRATCPTGALQMEGFDVSVPHSRGSRVPVYVDCWKAAASGAPEAAVRVPCLGGIAAYDLLQWFVDSGERPIVLLDRGWCGQCSAGSRISHPVEEALDAARCLMTELGVDESALPRLETRPLPVSAVPDAVPDPLAAQPISRRQFFAGMTRSAARTMSALRGRVARNANVPLRRTWRAAVTDTPRSRLMSHALALGARNGCMLPAELFPAIRVSDRCRNHRVCAAICPTGALQPYESGDEAGIRFDSLACIACGDCTRACPERALGLALQGSGAPDGAPAALTQWARRTCQRCDDEFASRGDEEHCPACRKDLSLFATGFPIGSQHT